MDKKVQSDNKNILLLNINNFSYNIEYWNKHLSWTKQNI